MKVISRIKYLADARGYRIVLVNDEGDSLGIIKLKTEHSHLSHMRLVIERMELYLERIIRTGEIDLILWYGFLEQYESYIDKVISYKTIEDFIKEEETGSRWIAFHELYTKEKDYQGITWIKEEEQE